MTETEKAKREEREDKIREKKLAEQRSKDKPKGHEIDMIWFDEKEE